ncbi:MAG: LysM peptidoglycan-binding domain-containing protein [Deltaproteobacteria bacterium]|nr:LysM peptidoglycan-binding domain-containing protein [Deltaproteobacteria bacterium]
MSRWGLSSYLLAAIVFLVLVDPPVGFSTENTAYISFKRVGVSRHHADPYTVKKNEYLFQIIREKYHVSDRESYQILELVKRFNPQLKDMNVIYPGQKLLLPRKRSSGVAPPGHPLPDELPDKKNENGVLKYVVKKGDSISYIINRFGNSHGEIYRVLRLVKRLNPKVKNFDSIYPGQTLFFPSEARRKAQPTAESSNVTIPEYKILPVISHIVSRMQGVVITDGSYGIPLPPSGEVTIDCSKVPVIEIPGGNTILLDLSNRIPSDLKGIIESTWNTYRVIGVKGKEMLPPLLERIVRAAGVYTLEKINRQVKIGDRPAVRVFIEWLVSKKSETGGAGRYGFNFLTGISDVLPLPVKTYAQRNGFEIFEIMNGFGITGDEAVYQPSPVQVLDSGGGLILADSLLRMLGHSPVRGAEITVLSGDGLSLSMKTGLLLNVGGTRVIMTSRRVSDPVLNILQEGGDRVVFISEERGRGEIIEDIVRAMNIPSSRDDFRFSLSRQTGKERGDISLPALRLGGGRDLYLVDYDVDKEIQGWYGIEDKRNCLDIRRA